MTDDTATHKESVKSIYQKIAVEYDERIPGVTELDKTFSDTEISYVLDRLSIHDEVLDIGCGTGRITLPLARHVGSVTGLDMSQAMLDQAAIKAAAAGLDVIFRQGDMVELPFKSQSFDAIVSILALMHVLPEERPRVFAEIYRVLRPGGVLLIGVKNAVFERFTSADRFATVDQTDVENKELVFTGTRCGEEMRAPWHSFSPEDLNRLSARAGLIPVGLRGNVPISAWLSDTVLAEWKVKNAVHVLERVFSDLAPLNQLGYHLLFEAVRPGGD